MDIARNKSSPLEQRQRLSQSIIWKLQRNFFNRRGVEAWSQDALPYQITSNPFIADAYARVVFGYLRDCQSPATEAEHASASAFDPAQPLFIVELGAGHGSFTYLFLKKFLKIHRHSVLKDIPIKYVMTDFATRNIEYWRTHPWLQPFVEQGRLDFARFDLENDHEIKLLSSGETLSPGTVRNPMVVIANYVFDTVPQDAFYIEDSKLYESLITVSTLRQEPDLEDPGILSRLAISYHGNPGAEDYYDDPEWNGILNACRQRLPGTAFLFPIVALRCIRNLCQLSDARLLLLSGDKGYTHDEALLLGQGIAGLTMHAEQCFSMMVDYRIVGDYFVRMGGQVLHPAHPHQSLNVSAFLLDKPSGNFLETRQAYEEAIEKFGPDDFFTLKVGFESNYDAFDLEQVLAYLRLSRWSPGSFWGCIPLLKQRLAHFSEVQKQEVSEAIKQVWDAYFPIGEEDDLAFHLGTLLLEMQFYSEALNFFQKSIDIYGVEPGTAYNMAVCYHGLRQMEKALERINQALELDPEFDAAKAMRIKLESSLGFASH